MQPTLRDRQRALTRTSIQNAALSLAIERGLNAITVAQIAEAAGVSVRTFFNHFATKEDAIAVPFRAFDPQAEAEFVTNSAIPLRDALERLARSYIAVLAPDPGSGVPHLEELLRAAGKDPRIASLAFLFFREAEERLAGLVGQRSGRPPHDMYCRLAALRTVAVVRVAMTERSRITDGPTRPSPTDILGAAFSLLRHLIEDGNAPSLPPPHPG